MYVDMVEYDEIAYWPNKVSLFLLNIVAYCDHLSFPSVEKSALWLSPCMWVGFPLMIFLQGVPKSVFLGPFLARICEIHENWSTSAFVSSKKT